MEDVIAFTGGGTGGHIYPGLAVIESLKSSGYKGRIVWIGSNKELDREIVENAGIEYFAIPSGKLRRSLSLHNLTDIFRIFAGFFASRGILKKLKPSVLFSKGGYVSVPPCRAAYSLGIPYITHESDATPGLATRLNAKNATLILTSWPDTASFFLADIRGKIRPVGNPVRPSILRGDALRGRDILGIGKDWFVVLFLGGSQGAKQVNNLVKEILPSLKGKVLVVHQTGQTRQEEKSDIGTGEKFAEKGKIVWNGNIGYLAYPYIGKELPDILATADVVAGRAGAGTIWEAANLGKPMILIPLAGSGTRGDQVENAEKAEEAGAAITLSGDAATPKALLEAIYLLINNKEKWERMHEAALRLARGFVENDSPPDAGHVAPNSADLVARIILSNTGK
jgi:UDP-N-acetylglucosamine--N-acetylmuramyl-(pentapeptide) pyrophosphoryl-undecaprenol N-acetylglucosamine transferase